MKWNGRAGRDSLVEYSLARSLGQAKRLCSSYQFSFGQVEGAVSHPGRWTISFLTVDEKSLLRGSLVEYSSSPSLWQSPSVHLAFCSSYFLCRLWFSPRVEDSVPLLGLWN